MPPEEAQATNQVLGGLGSMVIIVCPVPVIPVWSFVFPTWDAWFHCGFCLLGSSFNAFATKTSWVAGLVRMLPGGWVAKDFLEKSWMIMNERITYTLGIRVIGNWDIMNNSNCRESFESFVVELHGPAKLSSCPQMTPCEWHMSSPQNPFLFHDSSLAPHAATATIAPPDQNQTRTHRLSKSCRSTRCFGTLARLGCHVRVSWLIGGYMGCHRDHMMKYHCICHIPLSSYMPGTPPVGSIMLPLKPPWPSGMSQFSIVDQRSVSMETHGKSRGTTIYESKSPNSMAHARANCLISSKGISVVTQQWDYGIFQFLTTTPCAKGRQREARMKLLGDIKNAVKSTGQPGLLAAVQAGGRVHFRARGMRLLDCCRGRLVLFMYQNYKNMIDENGWSSPQNNYIVANHQDRTLGNLETNGHIITSIISISIIIIIIIIIIFFFIYTVLVKSLLVCVWPPFL